MNTKLIFEVDTLAKHMRLKYPHLREGQSLMNALHEIDATAYNQINQTDADCFYADAKIAAFWEAVVNM